MSVFDEEDFALTDVWIHTSSFIAFWNTDAKAWRVISSLLIFSKHTVGKKGGTVILKDRYLYVSRVKKDVCLFRAQPIQ
jgi:hypothetical protein